MAMIAPPPMYDKHDIDDIDGMGGMGGMGGLATDGPHALQSLPHTGGPRPPRARTPYRPRTLLVHAGLVEQFGGDTALTWAYLSQKAHILTQYSRRGSELITSWDELRTVLPTLLSRPSTTPPQPWSTIRLATVRTHLQTSGLVTWARKGTGDKRLRLTVHPERLDAVLQGLTVPPPAPIAPRPRYPGAITAATDVRGHARQPAIA